MKYPLDGYDFVAEVPRGIPLVIADHQGQTWRIARKGVRYHEDVPTLLHGARSCRPPPAVAATDRIRAIAEAILAGGGELPAGTGPATSTWRDAPRVVGSMASTLMLSTHGGWACAFLPVYDDAPRSGARRLTARETDALARDLATAPVAVRLPPFTVRERNVRIEAADPRIALARATQGASPLNARRVHPRDADAYAAALAAGARVLYAGGPCEVPDPGTAWTVPVTAWRAAQAR